MPPRTLFDISNIDLSQLVYDQEVIRSVNPQRGHMEHLNGIVYSHPPTGEMIGYKDVREDEFWVPGHIPGRPLLPGVIMIESAAQVSSFYTKHIVKVPGFIGFGAVEDCKFRMQVSPGCRMYLLTRFLWHRHGRICSICQGLVNGNVAFETTVVGTQM